MCIYKHISTYCCVYICTERYFHTTSHPIVYICVYICIYTYTYKTCTQACITNIHTSGMHQGHTYTNMCTHTNRQTVRPRGWNDLPVWLHRSPRKYRSMYVCMWVCLLSFVFYMYVCMYMYGCGFVFCMYVCMYVCTYVSYVCLSDIFCSFGISLFRLKLCV